ncbi:hypothetical protein F4802DRAFT_265259 [Xylaria palmicola]|nr:hypothetical protein F4802DRAFT_265259 [Xylaria palmicola]
MLGRHKSPSQQAHVMSQVTALDDPTPPPSPARRGTTFLTLTVTRSCSVQVTTIELGNGGRDPTTTAAAESPASTSAGAATAGGSSSSDDGVSEGTVIIVVVVLFILSFLFILCCLCRVRGRRKRGPRGPRGEQGMPVCKPSPHVYVTSALFYSPPLSPSKMVSGRSSLAVPE